MKKRSLNDRIEIILNVIQDSLVQIPKGIILIWSDLTYILCVYVFMDGKFTLQWFSTINYVPSGIIICAQRCTYTVFVQQSFIRNIFQVLTIVLMIWIIHTFKFPNYAVGSVLELYEAEYELKSIYLLVFAFWICWYLISL